VSKKILKFKDFSFSLKEEKLNKIEENSSQSILQQALQSLDGAKTQSDTSTETPKPTSLGKSKISIADLFYATSKGKKFTEELGREQNADLVKQLKKLGAIPEDLVPDPESVESQLQNPSTRKEVEENIKSLNDAGIPTATGTDSKALFDELISSGDYSFADVKELNWNGVKYILDKSGIGGKLDFDKYNLIGLRNYLSVKKNHPNRFVDALILMGPESKKEITIMPGTTVPGPFFMVQKFRNWWLATTSRSVVNPKGLAIVQPGIYSYKIGKHNGYSALVQNGKIDVERFPILDDPKKANFTTFSPGKAESGQFGINIHRGKKEGTTEKIDAYSAGCIVLKNSSDLEKILQKMKQAGQNEIDFALVEMDEIPKEVLASATKLKGKAGEIPDSLARAGRSRSLSS